MSAKVTGVSIKELKKGDRVEFYGEVFLVTGDLKVRKTEMEYHGGGEVTEVELPEDRWVYNIECKLQYPKLLKKSNISDILLRYSGFQGTEMVTFLRIEK